MFQCLHFLAREATTQEASSALSNPKSAVLSGEKGKNLGSQQGEGITHVEDEVLVGGLDGEPAAEVVG
jgi:hypothetical protein